MVTIYFIINTFKYHVSCTEGKISVRIIYFYYYFSIVVPLQLSTAQARRQKNFQHPIRHVENVALTTKGLQERKQREWDDGEKIGNKNK